MINKKIQLARSKVNNNSQVALAADVVNNKTTTYNAVFELSVHN